MKSKAVALFAACVMLCGCSIGEPEAPTSGAVSIQSYESLKDGTHLHKYGTEEFVEPCMYTEWKEESGYRERSCALCGHIERQVLWQEDESSQRESSPASSLTVQANEEASKRRDEECGTERTEPVGDPVEELVKESAGKQENAGGASTEAAIATEEPVATAESEGGTEPTGSTVNDTWSTANDTWN